ncbi:hypothetical protein JQF37_12530 [Pseudomonas sp. MIL9]|uniref:hypothetical protein n=1 Tax=Pseudomonas sp. MIL9 TaxID=2807620 RepID=UPI001951789D|nr:hypothetical protein [Pseudomonas sp. MIL9]MBM6444444.1 hypothetical protein [Pseudomonas sp. MIL9]
MFFETQASKLDRPEAIKDNRRMEVLYWFNRYQEAESSWASLDKWLATVRESRDYYVQVTDELRLKIKQQDTEIQKLRDALCLVSANLEELK